MSDSKRLVTYADSLTSGGDMDIKNNIKSIIRTILVVLAIVVTSFWRWPAFWFCCKPFPYWQNQSKSTI